MSYLHHVFASALIGTSMILFHKSIQAVKQPPKHKYYAGLEAGGTTMVMAIAEDEPNNIILKHEIDTGLFPETTLATIIAWFIDTGYSFDGIGVATFGPVELDEESEFYGFITSTPKPKWGFVDVLGWFRDAFEGVPLGFDTDVNGAVLAEQTYHEKTGNNAYITVGTGVGVGISVNGEPIHGMLHPEMGHIYVKMQEGETYEGGCPYHKCCLEGMVAAPNLSAKLGIESKDLPKIDDEDPIWDNVGYYLAQLCVSLILSVSPHKIIFGGGITKRKILLQNIRTHTTSLLANYIARPQLNDLSHYIVRSRFDTDAGVVGALVLAKTASTKK